ncbi:hypothetical protein [Streptomyces ipomoeae]|uniref:hypothetical protein n=1 Tax=Streptomyces ipomoeae TaxID=103232 RepID=UPI001146FCD6|nr:hypothetical protein [Streptomyces ipomoeae]MDX2932910.1 hypothetical protein [Streptomyces ipomoeae]TQE16435.1 hypothetical protein SipoB123_39970 [Streptomyces ipomoeae]
MAQSGQGEEPSARPAREGIVLPSDGSAPLMPGDLPPTPVQPTGRQQWGAEQDAVAPPAQPPGDAWGAGSGVDGVHGAGSAPMPEWGSQGAQGLPDYSEGQGAQGGHGVPLPPEGTPGGSYGVQTYGGAGFGVPLPPVAGEVSLPSDVAPPAPGGAPLPPVAGVDEGATQYIPYVPPVQPVEDAATQYIPPVAAGDPGAEAATQYLPPVGPGALPPEAPSDATTFLGRVPNSGAGPNGGAGPLPPAANPGHPGQPPHGAPPLHPDSQATQYIPPVAAQPQAQPYGAPQPQPQAHAQQPDVFDSLFRSEPEAAGATQQMPRIEQPYDAPQPPRGPGHGGPGHGGRGSGRRDGGGGGGRPRSRVPLIAAVGVVIAALGIGAGALMSSGSGSDQQSDNLPVSATEAAPEESASASADPAKEQAVALDKLLADSGASRNTVVKAVSNIRSCKNLGQAATDLRNAAKQRNDLVTKLGELSVDKLPDHAALTTSLTNAWKASASADNHYAAWADQVAGKKGCKKGQARTTAQTQAGNKASTTASTEKTKAAELWNSIASTYGLTRRQAGQL